MDARLAVQRVHLQAAVVGQGPGVELPGIALGLEAGVGEEGVAGLFDGREAGVAERSSQAKRPPVESSISRNSLIFPLFDVAMSSFMELS